MKGNRNVGGCPRGGGGGETKSPQERYDLIVLSISTEPEKTFFVLRLSENPVAKIPRLPVFFHGEKMLKSMHRKKPVIVFDSDD